MKNVAFLIGRLGQDPVVRYTQNGTAVASFSLATSESFKNRKGEKQEKTEWHKIVVFGKQAERCGEYLRKGRLVELEGKIESRTYTDKDGVKQKVYEIKAKAITFLPGGARVAKTEDTTVPAPEGTEADSGADEQDIPF